MTRLHGRLAKLEKKICNSRKMPIVIKLIYLGNEDWPEHEARVKKEYLAEHGTMAGLQIIRTWIPEPAPLPAAFRKPEA
jgi:hypothetical protein